MPCVSRIGDLGVGICCCHPPIPCIGMSGMLVTGSGDVSAENSNVSRISDVMLGFCGHVGVMVAGSPTVQANNLPVVRVGDPFVGCFTGVVVSGAATVTVDG